MAQPEVADPPRRRSRQRRNLLITAGDNHNRLRSEASFAALCGVNPLEASSGKTSRCLKRYLAREIYQIITSPPETEPPAA